MPHSSKTNWILIAAIFVAGLFAAAQFGKLTLTLAVIQNTYPDEKAWVPSLVSIVGIVGLIFGVVAGNLISRIGMSRIVLLALMVGGALSLIQSFLPPIWLFAFTRLIEGFSHLGLVIAAPTIIASVSTDADRPFAMGIWAAFFGASFAVTAFFLPTILDTGGLTLLFALHGVGMLAVAAVLWRMLPTDRPVVSLASGFMRSYRNLYSTPNLLLPGAGFVWYTATYIALLAVFPIALNLSATTIAMIPLVSIAGTIGAGVVAKSFAPHHVSIAGYIGSAVLMIAIWFGFDTATTLYALFFVMGAIPTGAFGSIAHFNSTTSERAGATGGVTHFGNIGTTFGTPLMVLAYQSAGLSGVTLMVLICCIGGVTSITLISKANSRRSP